MPSFLAGRSHAAEQDVAGIIVDPNGSEFSLRCRITDMDRQIASLQEIRNTMTPIFRLPNEILSQIMTVYAGPSPFDLKWTRIMLVCRHWHALALAAHHLWSFIEFGGPGHLRRVDAQLACSDITPLSVKFTSSSSTMFARLVLENSTRITSLVLAGEDNSLLVFLGKLCSFSFPGLRTLSLTPNSGSGYAIVAGSMPLAIPRALLEGLMPHLRDLALGWINLPFASMRGLRRLELRRCADATNSSRPTLDILLAALEASPQLHTLILDFAFWNRSIDVGATHRSVELSALEYLRHGVADISTHCTLLLTHLIFPSAASLHIYPMGVVDGANVRDMLVPVRQQLRAPPVLPLSLLQIFCEVDPIDSLEISHFLVALYADSAYHARLPEESDDDAGFLINSHPTSQLALRRTMSKIFKAIPFESITHLDTRFAKNLSTASWKAVFNLLPALQTIYLHSNSITETILRTLIRIESRSEPIGNQRASVPHLRCITIYAVWERGRIQDGNMFTLICALMDVLRLLYANGKPLEMGQDRWHEMSLLVGKVIRDGNVYTRS
ncbi:hypothetical protein FB451DRAFT_1236705 [Mycena latifolia]|nr:hypothetical protein FB451DRAFT_1236705 [Mycena latifolia]